MSSERLCSRFRSEAFSSLQHQRFAFNLNCIPVENIQVSLKDKLRVSLKDIPK